MKLKNPVSGMSATKVVAKAVMIMNNAFLIRCLIDSLLSRDSSRMISWESIPVPIAAMIPAMDGRSRFHLISVANPRMIRTSESETMISANAVLIFRYLMKTMSETAAIAKSAAIRICLVNCSPSRGEILSNFSISSL